MNAIEDIVAALAMPTREQRTRSAHGLGRVARGEYSTPDGRGGIEQHAREWFAWRDAETAGPMGMKAAARFARKG